jgi:methyl-accepting chemotaxis protein
MGEATNEEKVERMLVGMARMEETIKNISDQMKEVSKVTTLALQNDQAVKSAHNRIDDMKQEFNEKLSDVKKDYEERTANNKSEIEKLKDKLSRVNFALLGGGITVVGGIVTYFIIN